jgi:2-polyprenyl-3-methyl-5-hydroxy-6-metoxy-1,4-benzoquinol methylase
MNAADRDRWDRKYRQKEPPETITPDPFLSLALQGLSPVRALDVACGFGDNAIAMARAGFEVTATDISPVGLARAKIRAEAAGVAIRFIETDAEDFDYGQEDYELITVFYFLNRVIVPRVTQGLRRGGHVLYKTYTVGELRYRPSLNREYLLAPGELQTMFEGCHVLLHDEVDNGREAFAKLLAQRYRQKHG